jgi:hypothetical protein
MLDSYATLVAMTETTYKARLELAKRIQIRGRLWSAALVSSALASSLVGIAMLGDDQIYGPYGNYMWVMLGVTTLSASLIITSVNYGERTLVCFQAYRQFQTLSMRAWIDFQQRVIPLDDTAAIAAASRILNAEYQVLLDTTPNHSRADYARSLYPELKKRQQSSQQSAEDRRQNAEILRAWKWVLLFDNLLTCAPATLAVLSLALIAPALVWLFNG